MRTRVFCGLVSVLAGLLLTGMVLSRHAPVAPSSGQVQSVQAAQTVAAGSFFTESEPNGVALCFARTALTTFPPMFSGGMHPAPVAASYGGSYGSNGTIQPAQGGNP